MVGSHPMRLIVPTLNCDCLVLKDYDDYGLKAGETKTLPFGVVLLLKAFGIVGAISNETEKYMEAMEGIAVYGADHWFPHNLQTIGHIAETLAKAGETAEDRVH